MYMNQKLWDTGISIVMIIQLKERLSANKTANLYKEISKKSKGSGKVSTTGPNENSLTQSLTNVYLFMVKK